MRELTPSLTAELEKHVGKLKIDAAPAFPIGRYSELVEHIAQLSFLNRDSLLFFRGQHADYRSKAGSSTYYPTIYRGEYLSQNEIGFRFELLEEACRQLRSLFADEAVQGHKEVGRRKSIQWSILQHYGVCATPLLDLTHSLRVACSFAQLDAPELTCNVAVFGLPYFTNRITINSEHDLVLVRLLSICPPSALRPYFQEGYLAGTADITSEYETKTELDFKMRLIAKFEIHTGRPFWGTGFSAIPASVLYPADDRVEEICGHIRTRVREEILPGQLGIFIKEWTDLEQEIVNLARKRDPSIHTIRSALDELADSAAISSNELLAFDRLRSFRNVVAHVPREVTHPELTEKIAHLRDFRQRGLRQRGK